jgi:hypothetical protein
MATLFPELMEKVASLHFEKSAVSIGALGRAVDNRMARVGQLGSGTQGRMLRNRTANQMGKSEDAVTAHAATAPEVPSVPGTLDIKKAREHADKEKLLKRRVETWRSSTSGLQGASKAHESRGRERVLNYRSGQVATKEARQARPVPRVPV